MTVARHVNPPGDRPVAQAPYNFVPLPEAIWAAEVQEPCPWQAHDHYLPEARNGWLDLRIETLTPLFIRGPLRGGQTAPDATPWATPEGRPVIPGSSLRGMLRTLVEILTSAKITPVSDSKPFFRTFAPDRVGKAYATRIAPGGEKPEGGFLERHEGSWVVRPAEVLRIDHDVLRDLAFPYRIHPNYTPSWNWQHKPCWVQRARDRVIALRLQPEPGWTEGTLVLTGSMKRKHTEYVLVRTAGAKPVEVPDQVWERFHDDDQISQWQEQAFPVGKPGAVPDEERRAADGHLRKHEPVFFVRGSDGRVEFLGRARMFRFPYPQRLSDLVPEHLRGGLDRAEVLFGRVARNRDDKQPTIKGRVFVEDAVALGDGDWLQDEFTPHVLSSPKPTTFPHYLTQDGRRPKRDLTTYLDGDDTALRGHKLYWHRWDDDRGRQAIEAAPSPASEPSTQHTRITPVAPTVVFEGRIRFENLTDVELGAVLAALDLPEGYAHKLGMGKPLGMGSVRITPTLHLVDRTRRYQSWEDSGEVAADEVAETGRRCRERFEEAALAHASASGETLLPDGHGLRQIARLDALFTMLRYEGRPPWEATDYLPLDAFRNRNILPTPHRVAGLDEPPWPDSPPSPGAAPQARPRGSRPALPRPEVVSTARCRVLDERTKKGGWVFLLPDGRQGVLAPSSPTPPDLAPGKFVEFVLVTDPPRGERVQLRWVDPSASPTVVDGKSGREAPGSRGRGRRR